MIVRRMWICRVRRRTGGGLGVEEVGEVGEVEEVEGVEEVKVVVVQVGEALVVEEGVVEGVRMMMMISLRHLPGRVLPGLLPRRRLLLRLLLLSLLLPLFLLVFQLRLLLRLLPRFLSRLRLRLRLLLLFRLLPLRALLEALGTGRLLLTRMKKRNRMLRTKGKKIDERRRGCKLLSKPHLGGRRGVVLGVLQLNLHLGLNLRPHRYRHHSLGLRLSKQLPLNKSLAQLPQAAPNPDQPIPLPLPLLFPVSAAAATPTLTSTQIFPSHPTKPKHNTLLA